jgi:shikimate kinase
MMHSGAAKRSRVYLTGFMGSGKSTIGPILANCLAYDFVDLDREIELHEGVSIARIFRDRGEKYFRRKEKEWVLDVSTRLRTVISLGGGALVDQESYRIVRQSGLLIYLKLPPEELYERLRRQIHRPLLTDDKGRFLRGAELQSRIETLYRERHALYESADLTIASDQAGVGITVDRILKEISPLVE